MSPGPRPGGYSSQEFGPTTRIVAVGQGHIDTLGRVGLIFKDLFI